MKNRLKLVAGLAALALPLLAPLRVAAQSASDPWTFSIMPYLWLPSLDGKLRYGPPPAGGASPNVSMDSDGLLSDINAAFMVTGEARKGKWSIVTDVMYLDMSGSDSSVKSIDFNPGSGPINLTNSALDGGTDTSVTGTIWTLVGGYSVVQKPYATLDIIGGFRYFDLEASTDWRLSATVTGPAGAQTFGQTGNVTKSEHLWDGLVGIRGRLKLAETNWFAPYYFDVGTGDSKLTWQAMAGIGYSLTWGDLVFAYRYLSYEQDDNKLVEDLHLGGFGFGVNFRF